MRSRLGPLLVLSSCVLLARVAGAADYYASPTGSGSTCSQAAPCSAGTAAGKTNPGDTVHLADGTYSYTVTATDAAGNTSQPSGALAFTVDTMAPNAPTISDGAVQGGYVNAANDTPA